MAARCVRFVMYVLKPVRVVLLDKYVSDNSLRFMYRPSSRDKSMCLRKEGFPVKGGYIFFVKNSVARHRDVTLLRIENIIYTVLRVSIEKRQRPEYLRVYIFRISFETLSLSFSLLYSSTTTFITRRVDTET